MQPRSTVFLVDDDPSVLKALARLVRANGWEAEAFASPEAFFAGFDPGRPGCLVLDVAMPGIDGLELQRRLQALGDPLPIVFLTAHGDVPTSVRAMRAGAVNFLEKPADEAALVGAIGDAMARDRAERAERSARTAATARVASLTPREREVLALVVAGKLNKQIAWDLGTAEKTVKVHRARVMEKMGVESLAELVRAAQLAGLPEESVKA